MDAFDFLVQMGLMGQPQYLQLIHQLILSVYHLNCSSFLIHSIISNRPLRPYPYLYR